METNTKNNEDIQPLSPEEIKAIGEIAIGPSKHEQFLNAHYKKLMWGGISLGIAAGCIIAFFSHRNDKQVDAAALVVQSMKITQPGQGVASADEYDTAALDTLQQDYSGTPSAATAGLMQGLSLLAKGDEAGASALEAVANGDAPVALKARALAALATHQLQQQKDSVPTWTRIAQMEANPYSALAYLMLGDLAKDKGDKEAARSWYEQGVAKCPTSALVTDKTMEMRLTLLEVDAPTPVEAAPQPAQPAGNPLGSPFGEVPEVGNTEFNPEI